MMFVMLMLGDLAVMVQQVVVGCCLCCRWPKTTGLHCMKLQSLYCNVAGNLGHLEVLTVVRNL